MAISASIDLGYKISEIKVNEYFDLGNGEELKNQR